MQLGALGAGITYLVIGDILGLLADLRIAIRDIAIQTHHAMIARAIPQGSDPAPPAESYVEPIAA